MNMISRIRRQIVNNGSVTLHFDEYNQLQKEWVKRCIDDETLEKHDIEQQIDGAISFAAMVNDTGQLSWSDCQWLTDFAEEFEEQLRQQAKGES
jgi:hypothetical protein